MSNHHLMLSILFITMVMIPSGNFAQGENNSRDSVYDRDYINLIQSTENSVDDTTNRQDTNEESSATEKTEEEEKDEDEDEGSSKSENQTQIYKEKCIQTSKSKSKIAKIGEAVIEIAIPDSLSVECKMNESGSSTMSVKFEWKLKESIKRVFGLN